MPPKEKSNRATRRKAERDRKQADAQTMEVRNFWLTFLGAPREDKDTTLNILRSRMARKDLEERWGGEAEARDVDTIVMNMDIVQEMVNGYQYDIGRASRESARLKMYLVVVVHCDDLSSHRMVVTEVSTLYKPYEAYEFLLQMHLARKGVFHPRFHVLGAVTDGISSVHVFSMTKPRQVLSTETETGHADAHAHPHAADEIKVPGEEAWRSEALAGWHCETCRKYPTTVEPMQCKRPATCRSLFCSLACRKAHSCRKQTCGKCGRHSPTMQMCSLCRSITYCGKECQKQHWTAKHKQQCAKMKAYRTLVMCQTDDKKESETETETETKTERRRESRTETAAPFVSPAVSDEVD